MQTLDEQLDDFRRRRFLAVPLAGLIVWALMAVTNLFVSSRTAAFVLFFGAGSIVYLGLILSRFTGEFLTDRSKPSNAFDTLFYLTVGQALAVFAIAIPFFIVDYQSLPLSLGILTGLMWIPFSWMIGHWIGFFHTGTRTALVVIAWYAFPDYRFTLIPALVVLVYIVTIVVLELRWRRYPEIIND